MELEHSFTVPVPRERAWEVLLDVERVAPCMPGASLDSVDGDAIHGRIKVKVGPIAMTYAGTARFTERDAEAGVVTLEASGKETRGSGTASASVRSVLEDHGAETHVTVHTSLNVTGKPAQFGRGVMSEVSGKLIGIFAANLAEMLSAAPGPDAAPVPESAAAPAADAPAAAVPAADAPAADAPAAVATDPGPATAGDERAKSAAGDDLQSALALPLEELHLPLRSYNSLRREGVHTVGELAARTPQDLLAIENIGRASVEEIRQKLAERGLSLGESPATANGAQPSPDDATAPAAAGTTTAGPEATATTAATAAGTAAAGTAAAGTAAAGTPAAGTPAAGTPAAGTSPPGPAWAPSRQPDDDAINLISVAGMPVLKRAIPVLAGLVAAVLVALGVRFRRRRKRG